jgi:hypothetical protein
MIALAYVVFTANCLDRAETIDHFLDSGSVLCEAIPEYAI